MKKEALIVRCTYADTEDSLAALLEKSFRLFLICTFAKKADGAVSCSR